MARTIESVFIQGPAGRLEGLFEDPGVEAPKSVALVCHPHPQHGGTMHNKVVFRLAKGLRQAGHAVLRFNYRGVGLSEGSYAQGEGELDDARSALSFLRQRYPDLPFTLAGFSFGSRIVLRLGCEQTGAQGVVAVGFPTVYKDRSYLEDCTSVPRVFIQSTRDEFGPVEELEGIVAGLKGTNRLIKIEAKDHFFAGALEQLEKTVTELGDWEKGEESDDKKAIPARG